MTTNNNLDALFADAELPFGHPGRRNFDDSPAGYTDFDDRYEPPPVDPPEEERRPLRPPATGPSAATRAPFAGLHRRPDSGRLRPAWSSSPRTCRTRTPITGATASTAAGRSPPPAPSNGAGWSGGHARTAEGQDGNDQQGLR